MFRSIFILVFTALALLLSSCSGKQETRIPGDILAKEKMAEILADIHIQEAALSLNLASRDSSSDSVEPLYLSVLKKHGVEQPLYDESFSFYSKHPELMNALYEEVITMLSKRKAKEQ